MTTLECRLTGRAWIKVLGYPAVEEGRHHLAGPMLRVSLEISYRIGRYRSKFRRRADLRPGRHFDTDQEWVTAPWPPTPGQVRYVEEQLFRDACQWLNVPLHGLALERATDLAVDQAIREAVAS